MKKIGLILLIAIIGITHSLDAMQWLCCCRSKKKAREQWKKVHIVHDLNSIGITCTQEQFEQLPFDQQLFLSGLKSAHTASSNYDQQLGNGVNRAEQYPEPFKTQLKQFCAAQIATRELPHRIVIVHPENGWE